MSIDWHLLLLQPWLDGLVLSIKVGHIWHQVLYNVHVWEWVDLADLAAVLVDSRKASQVVLAIDIHRAATANSLSAGSSKTQSRVLLILDLDKCIQNHLTGHLVQVNLVLLHDWRLSVIGIPSVDLEGFGSAARGSSRDFTELRFEHFRFIGYQVLYFSEYEQPMISSKIGSEKRNIRVKVDEPF